MIQKTKKGATSIIVIVFFALLAGILVLSFASLMITNMRETTNYNLSQSAYDAAQAGTEDAKVMLIEYNNCIARSDYSGPACERIKNTLNDEKSSDDCNIIKEALGRSDAGDTETLVRTEASDTGDIDMAYTCVKVTIDTDDYLGTLDSNLSDFRIIPLRAAGDVNVVQVSWFHKTLNFEGENGDGPVLTNYGSLYNAIADTATFSSNKDTGPLNNSHNQYNKNVIAVPPIIDVGLIQAPDAGGGKTNFKLTDFNSNVGDSTNRGYLSLRPNISAGKGLTEIIASNANSGFPASVKAGGLLNRANYSNPYLLDSNSGLSNTPIDIKCHDPITGGDYQEYLCNANIELPKAVADGHGGKPVNNNVRFLTLSLPYSAPTTSFSVKMYHCNTISGNNIADETNCTPVQFKGVQSKVDSTGRANNVFRRVESRIEMGDVAFPFPKYIITQKEDGNGIKKKFEATVNCWNVTNGTAATCHDYNEITANFDN